MKKITVVGCGGAGKSTLSRQLSEILNINVYHLDSFYWKEGWVASSKEEFDRTNQELVSKPEWILDGNFGRTMDVRLNASDIVIFMDMPTFLCFYRVMKRRIMYHNKSRPDMAYGCKESLDTDFIRWILTYRKTKRPGIMEKLKSLENKKLIILKNRRMVKEFIGNLKANSKLGN